MSSIMSLNIFFVHWKVLYRTYMRSDVLSRHVPLFLYNCLPSSDRKNVFVADVHELNSTCCHCKEVTVYTNTALFGKPHLAMIHIFIV